MSNSLVEGEDDELHYVSLHTRLGVVGECRIPRREIQQKAAFN
jgi:hypothetical protein